MVAASMRAQTFRRHEAHPHTSGSGSLELAKCLLGFTGGGCVLYRRFGRCVAGVPATDAVEAVSLYYDDTGAPRETYSGLSRLHPRPFCFAADASSPDMDMPSVTITGGPLETHGPWRQGTAFGPRSLRLYVGQHYEHTQLS